MTNYPREAYGSTNPNAGRPANGDRDAWGGYAWPQGVPGHLLGTTDYVSATAGQRIRVTMRKELVPLWEILFAIADKHKYPTWAQRNGENWGPWGYENRAVSGTSTPSGHSMALSVDINAPNNPYSTAWQSDMPPALVADYEACGMYWGGRYTGRYDPMHYGYCFPPSSVGGHIETARRILGGSTGGKDWFDDMATVGDLEAAVWKQINRPEYLESVAEKVWDRVIREGDSAAALLAAAKDQSRWASDNTANLGVQVWTTQINDEKANTLLARAAAT